MRRLKVATATPAVLDKFVTGDMSAQALTGLQDQ